MLFTKPNAFYKPCRLCGANLDPGERCDEIFFPPRPGEKRANLDPGERCDCTKKPGLLTTATGHTPHTIDGKGSIIIPVISPSHKREAV